MKFVYITRNTIISYHLFNYKITFVNSQRENTNSKGGSVLKSRFVSFIVKISCIQKNLCPIYCKSVMPNLILNYPSFSPLLLGDNIYIIISLHKIAGCHLSRIAYIMYSYSLYIVEKGGLSLVTVIASGPAKLLLYVYIKN